MAPASSSETAELLFEIASHDSGSTETKLQQSLMIAMLHLDLDVGMISHIEGDDYTIKFCHAPQTSLKPGMVLPYRDTVCYQTLNKHTVTAIDKLSETKWAKPPLEGEYRAEAYIAVPLIVNGEVYGTLNLSSDRARPLPFSKSDQNFVMMFSRWVGTALKLLQTEADLKVREDLLEGVIQSSQQGIIAFEALRDDAGQIHDFCVSLINPIAQVMFDALESSVLRQPLFKVFPSLLETGMAELYKNVVETAKPLNTEMPISHPKTGDTHWFNLSGVKLNDGLVVTFYEMTEQKQREDQLAILAFQDNLTGLASRAVLNRDFPQLLSMADRNEWKLALIYFDLNSFKVINDNHGHDMGDKVLQMIGKRLLGVARHNEPTVRLGGDEFLFVATKVSRDEAVCLAERLISEIEKPIEFDGHVFLLGVSIGIYMRECEEVTPLHIMLNRADAAMFSAKKTKSFAQSSYVFWSKD